MADLAKYATAYSFAIPVLKLGSNDGAASADWTPAAGDVKVVRDGTVLGNIGTLPTAVTVGNRALWTFSLTTTEMTGKEIIVAIADATSGRAVEDQIIRIQTFGNASAAIVFDLSSATTTPGAGTITSSVIAANAIGSSQLAANAIGASQIASGAIVNTSFAANAIDSGVLASSAANEIRDAVWAQAMTELAAVPGVTGTTLAALEWVFLMASNRRTQTATLETLRNRANTADIATSTTSDDATTFVRGSFT